jgi:flagellin
MNTHRWLQSADAAMAKNLNRLSSGYRINSGADDAAGLAVSQQFRADIASFRVASRNASEATSLLQVADGALDQVANILTRLKELATQAASANTSSTNRSKLNDEAAKLILEADRIADSTKYGDDLLINGAYGVSVESTTGTDAVGLTTVSGMTLSEEYNITVSAGSDATHWDVQVTTGGGAQTIQDALATPSAGSTGDVYFAAFGVTVTFADTIAASSTAATVTASSEGASTFRVGATANDYDAISISLGDATTGASGLNIATLNISTVSGSESAMTTINLAISTLSNRRGAIGAYMNRLTYASANLATTIENVQGAESTIRDVDMAAEMTEFTKNQILTQAGTAMLAQANLSAQTILTLFR